MIQLHDLRIGDLVLAEYEGQKREGEVTDLSHADKEICIETSVQAFWYKPEEVDPIPLDDEQLMKFHFERKEQPDGTVKYLLGPFRILIPQKGNFSHFEMWYREDRRHIMRPIFVHDLQNHYNQMTKIDLTREPGVQAF
jgi:hypothetical protein